MNAVPQVGPYVGAVPEDRHAERVVGEMLAYLDDFTRERARPQLYGRHGPADERRRSRLSSAFSTR